MILLGNLTATIIRSESTCIVSLRGIAVALETGSTFNREKGKELTGIKWPGLPWCISLHSKFVMKTGEIDVSVLKNKGSLLLERKGNLRAKWHPPRPTTVFYKEQMEMTTEHGSDIPIIRCSNVHLLRGGRHRSCWGARFRNNTLRIAAIRSVYLSLIGKM